MDGSAFIEELVRRRMRRELDSLIEQERALIARQSAWQAGYEHILDVVTARFNPPAARYRKIERRLKRVASTEQLRRLLLVLVQADDLETFEQALEQSLSEQPRTDAQRPLVSQPVPA